MIKRAKKIKKIKNLITNAIKKTTVNRIQSAVEEAIHQMPTVKVVVRSK
jgi:DNA-binding CsgD family transcriptional regulator